MEIEKVDMKEALEREFRDDPIYKMCLINHLEDELFPEPILSMHHETSYSTVDTGKILNRPDSTIRNHFRSELIEYIAPERFGKYYRMDYRCVFKLHMIFLLMEKRGKSTVDILVELGIEPAVAATNYNSRRGTLYKSVPPQKNEVGPSEELIAKVEALTKMVEQIMNTGLYEVKELNGNKQIVLKEEYSQTGYKLLQENNEDVEKLKQENKELKEKIEQVNKTVEENKKDVAVQIKERRLETQVRVILQAEALRKWAEQNKAGLIAKLFQSEKYEIEKVEYINRYVEEHINERLKEVIKERETTID